MRWRNGLARARTRVRPTAARFYCGRLPDLMVEGCLYKGERFTSRASQGRPAAPYACDHHDQCANTPRAPAVRILIRLTKGMTYIW